MLPTQMMTTLAADYNGYDDNFYIYSDSYNYSEPYLQPLQVAARRSLYTGIAYLLITVISLLCYVRLIIVRILISTIVHFINFDN